MTTYKSTARSVSDLKAHLVLTTKYRRKAITPAMLTRRTFVGASYLPKMGMSSR